MRPHCKMGGVRALCVTALALTVRGAQAETKVADRACVDIDNANPAALSYGAPAWRTSDFPNCKPRNELDSDGQCWRNIGRHNKCSAFCRRASGWYYGQPVDLMKGAICEVGHSCTRNFDYERSLSQDESAEVGDSVSEATKTSASKSSSWSLGFGFGASYEKKVSRTMKGDFKAPEAPKAAGGKTEDGGKDMVKEGTSMGQVVGTGAGGSVAGAAGAGMAGAGAAGAGAAGMAAGLAAGGGAGLARRTPIAPLVAVGVGQAVIGVINQYAPSSSRETTTSRKWSADLHMDETLKQSFAIEAGKERSYGTSKGVAFKITISSGESWSKPAYADNYCGSWFAVPVMGV